MNENPSGELRSDLGRGITTVVSWAVEPQHAERFEALIDEIGVLAEEFCGHQGVTWLRPDRGEGFYHSVLRFSDEERLLEWTRLPERLAWLHRVHAIAREVREAEPKITGTETWFSLPERPTQAPPKWKATLVTMLGAYPVAFGIGWLIAPQVASWPLPLRAATFPVVAAPLLTFVIMPRLSRLFRRWLYPDAPHRMPSEDISHAS